MDKDARIALLTRKLNTFDEMYKREHELRKSFETKYYSTATAISRPHTGGSSVERTKIVELERQVEQGKQDSEKLQREVDRLCMLSKVLKDQLAAAATSAHGAAPSSVGDLYPAEERELLLEQIEDLKRQVYVGHERRKLVAAPSELEALKVQYQNLHRENQTLYMLYTQAITENQQLISARSEAQAIRASPIGQIVSQTATSAEYEAIQTENCDLRKKLATAIAKKNSLKSEKSQLIETLKQTESVAAETEKKLTARLLEQQTEHLTTTTAKEKEMRSQFITQVQELRKQVEGLPPAVQEDSQNSQYQALLAMYQQLVSKHMFLDSHDAFAYCSIPASVVEMRESFEMEKDELAGRLATSQASEQTLKDQLVKAIADINVQTQEISLLKAQCSEEAIQKRVQDELQKQMNAISPQNVAANRLLSVLHKTLKH